MSDSKEVTVKIEFQCTFPSLLDVSEAALTAAAKKAIKEKLDSLRQEHLVEKINRLQTEIAEANKMLGELQASQKKAKKDGVDKAFEILQEQANFMKNQ